VRCIVLPTTPFEFTVMLSANRGGCPWKIPKAMACALWEGDVPLKRGLDGGGGQPLPLLGVNLLRLQFSTPRWLASWSHLLELKAQGSRRKGLPPACWTRRTSRLCISYWIRKSLRNWNRCMGLNFSIFSAVTWRHCLVGASNE
jgi:hypothetical protein